MTEKQFFISKLESDWVNYFWQKPFELLNVNWLICFCKNIWWLLGQLAILIGQFCNFVGQAESKHLPSRWCCMMGRAVLCSGNIRPKNSRPKSNRRFLLFCLSPIFCNSFSEISGSKGSQKDKWLNSTRKFVSRLLLKRTFSNDQNLVLQTIWFYLKRPKLCNQVRSLCLFRWRTFTLLKI